MKRFYVTAAIAASLLATGCQKTYVIDEVRTPIGFSTEVGKQTKVIVNDETYLVDQPFGVFAYGKQGTTSTTVMENVIISQVAVESSNKVWKATDGNTYYWPNDPTTKLSFYAYSPYSKADGAVGMKKNPSYVEPAGENAGGIKIEGYVHADQTLDFMTASAENRTFKEPDGAGETPEKEGTVKLTFKHQLTQLVFAVKKADNYAGIDMTLQSITLNNIGNTATFENGEWGTPSTYSGTYDVDYSAVTDKTFTKTGAVTSKGMTVIPQALADESGTTSNGQTMTIVYEISGTGVAKETVTKTVDLYTQNLTKWEPNQKITYNISIGMQEILFNPSVSTWTTPESSAEVPIN